MAEVKWIKITTNMFDDEKIKLIDAMPEKDTIFYIWIRLLVQAGKTNAGGLIFMSQDIPYTDEMLSTIFNRPLNSVRLALDTLKKFGMIQKSENDILKITNWEKYQNVDGMESIKRQNRVRKQRQRENQKLLRDCHVTSRDSHATEQEQELDIEQDKDDVEEDEKAPQFFDKKCKEVTELFLNSGMGTVSNNIIADTLTDISKNNSIELIKEAFTIAASNHAKSIRYAEKILISWQEKGIKTLQQLQEYTESKKGVGNNGSKGTNIGRPENKRDTERNRVDFSYKSTGEEPDDTGLI